MAKRFDVDAGAIKDLGNLSEIEEVKSHSYKCKNNVHPEHVEQPEKNTSQWLDFFTKAGLPPNVAANYAHIFSDNCIQLDMLMDLSKDFLYDMGIIVVGDVIRILKFAKEFHTQIEAGAIQDLLGNLSEMKEVKSHIYKCKNNVHPEHEEQPGKTTSICSSCNCGDSSEFALENGSKIQSDSNEEFLNLQKPVKGPQVCASAQESPTSSVISEDIFRVEYQSCGCYRSKYDRCGCYGALEDFYLKTVDILEEFPPLSEGTWQALIAVSYFEFKLENMECWNTKEIEEKKVIYKNYANLKPKTHLEYEQYYKELKLALSQ